MGEAHAVGAMESWEGGDGEAGPGSLVGEAQGLEGSEAKMVSEIPGNNDVTENVAPKKRSRRTVRLAHIKALTWT